MLDVPKRFDKVNLLLLFKKLQLKGMFHSYLNFYLMCILVNTFVYNGLIAYPMNILCHMSSHFSGGFIISDDITLPAPSADALNAMLKVS